MSVGIDQSWQRLTSSDGHQFDSFFAAPRQAPLGAVVVLQELFGVNAHIQGVVRKFAQAGYVAVAPALFDRSQPRTTLAYDAAGIANGKALAGALDTKLALLDVAAAALPLSGARLPAIVGFCWGGTLAWLAASEMALSGVIAYYGGQIGMHLDRTPSVPVLTHFGSRDSSIPLTVTEELKQRHPSVICHLYDAGHGFNCDERPSFDEASAGLAFARSLGFLRATS